MSKADTIPLLDEGRIRAEGSHEEIIRSDAGYAELFEAQGAGVPLTAKDPLPHWTDTDGVG